MLFGDVGLGDVGCDLGYLCAAIRRHLQVIFRTDPWKKQYRELSRLITEEAALSSSSSDCFEKPYVIVDPPNPSPWETSTISTPASSKPPAIRLTCSAVS